MSKIYHVLFIHFYKSSDIKLNDNFIIKKKFAFDKDFTLSNLNIDKYDIVILGPGKSKLNPKASDMFKYVPNLRKILQLKNKKILGLCYGMQLLCRNYNLKVQPLKLRHKETTKKKIKGMPVVRVRFNHKFKCSNTKKNLNDMKIKDEKEVKKIPTFIKFSKNHFGVQFHFTNKNDRSNMISKIIENQI